jgi:hypothetical protein
MILERMRTEEWIVKLPSGRVRDEAHWITYWKLECNNTKLPRVDMASLIESTVRCMYTKRRRMVICTLRTFVLPELYGSVQYKWYLSNGLDRIKILFAALAFRK